MVIVIIMEKSDVEFSSKAQDLGNTDRHHLREDLSNILLDYLIIGCDRQVLFHNISACEIVAEKYRPHGLFGMLLSQRQGQDVFPSVVAEFMLVSCYRRSSDTSTFLRRALAMRQIVAAGGEVGISNSSPGTSSLSSVHCHVSDWLGSSVTGLDRSMDVDFLKERPSYRCARVEGSSAVIDTLHQISGETLVLMSYNATVLAYLKNQRSTESMDTQVGPGGHGMTRHIPGRRPFWQISKTIQIKFFPRSSLFFPGCSMASTKGTAIFLLICLLPGRTQSFPCMCHPFWIQWHG